MCRCNASYRYCSFRLVIVLLGACWSLTLVLQDATAQNVGAPAGAIIGDPASTPGAAAQPSDIAPGEEATAEVSPQVFIVADSGTLPGAPFQPMSKGPGAYLLTEFDSTSQEIESAKRAVRESQDALIVRLKQLQDAYCRAAMLDEAVAVREQLRGIQSELIPTSPEWSQGTTTPQEIDPQSVRNRVGETFYSLVAGQTGGSVWGTDVYTTDSSLAAAAVHSGCVADGQTRIVRFTILPGQPSYSSATRNGVTSRQWGQYSTSFRIDGAADPAESFQPHRHRGEDIPAVTLFVVGSTEGWVWGGEDAVYTDDSKIATAAVHAGLVQPGQPGFVALELLRGHESYTGSSANGVASSDYGPWNGSFRLKAVDFSQPQCAGATTAPPPVTGSVEPPVPADSPASPEPVEPAEAPDSPAEPTPSNIPRLQP